MKAVQINAYGGNEALEVNENAPIPSLKPNQILIEAYAVSINPFDVSIKSGYLQKTAPLQFPVTMGGDFAGIASKVQEGSNFNIGDEVYGQAIILNGGSGSFAQFIAANIANIALKPKNTSFAFCNQLFHPHQVL